MFDIKKQDYSKAAEVGYKFEVKLPSGVGAGAYFTVIGDLSPTVKLYSRARFEEYRAKEAMLARKGKSIQDTLDLDEAEAMAVDAALVRLIGWEGITEDGKPVEFSKEKARSILTQHSFLREQIIAEAADVMNHSPEAKKA